MSNDYVQVAPDSTGKKLDTESLVVGANTVHRQRGVVADPADTAAFAAVKAKGAQGAYALTTQDLKDSGRSRVEITFHSTAPATAETLLSLVKITAGVAAAGATSIAVASGKTLRLTNIILGVTANAAAAAFAMLHLRSNPSGATVIGSQLIARIPSGLTGAAANNSVIQNIVLGEGYEFSGTQTLGISLSAQATTNIISITLIGYEY